MKVPVLYTVVPCYNEQEVLPETSKRLLALYKDLIDSERIDPASRITLVDDGSKDATWAMLAELAKKHEHIEAIKLAHNVGHQNALWAGMMSVRDRADAVITIDADLQDDPNAIYGFLDEYHNGAEIVYGVRSKRDTDTAFKRTTARAYYRFMSMMGVDLMYDHADYRLLGSRALEALSQFGEVNLFLRGMVPLLGFQTATVYYERAERFAGESKYPLKKMVSFALEGITSFSIKPIRWVLILGVIFSLLALLMGIYAVVAHFAGSTVPGWSSIMVSIWFIGGVQLIALGLIGEYIGKLYVESKHRPRFIIEEYEK